MFKLPKKETVREFCLWGLLLAVLAGIAYLAFIPEDETERYACDDDEDYDEFPVGDDEI
ncbi:MAG: hypothetical protein IKR19_09050 [Acholeplasmatales bacterium]|nr:hypothetical protein [Acholeplasmatales bacterium]